MDFDLKRSNRPGVERKRWTGRKKRIVLFSVVSGGLVVLCVSLLMLLRGDFTSPESMVPVVGSPDAPFSREPPPRVVEGEVREGSSFSRSLTEEKVPARWIELIVSKLKPYVDFKKIRGGTYRLVFDTQGELSRFVYEKGPTEVFEIEKEFDLYIARKKEVPLQVSIVRVGGEIHSSLFEAMDAAGEGDPLILSFAEVLASEIDFYKDVKEGDRFKVVVEKVYKGDEFIRYGTIHAVEYQRGEKAFRGIRYQDEYYDERGNSLKKAFLRAPLRFNRISSRFSRARKHPILGGVRPHYGVDYAAPPGTPVWAVSDGTVFSCGWGGGFGNQVILRHGNGYVSCYGHLSNYGPGIRRGVRVKQKQVIGYVGSTGLSTGPHLDYRLVKDGRFSNPLKETFPAGNPLRKEDMEQFQKRRGEALSWLQGDTPLKKDL